MDAATIFLSPDVPVRSLPDPPFADLTVPALLLALIVSPPVSSLTPVVGPAVLE
jgi:hypothetical protein